MKHIKLILLLFPVLFFENSNAQTYNQPAEVISSGGGESTGGIYSNFGVTGETFVDYSITGGNYNTNIGFLYASGIVIGIEEIDFINNINIYPNPNTGKFVIEMEITKVTDLEIKLFNILGQTIYEEKLNIYAGTYQKEIYLSKQGEGIYFLEIGTNEGTIRKKVSVVR